MHLTIKFIVLGWIFSYFLLSICQLVSNNEQIEQIN